MIELVFFATENIYLISGIVLISLAVLQMSFWIGGSISGQFAQHRHFQLNQQILEQKLAAAKTERRIAEMETSWNGERTFRVSKLVRESREIVSLYLTPLDHRPLPFFKPGQYLTFSFVLPGEKKPLVRCYSISSVPNEEYYRCTIKRVPQMDANDAMGKVSTWCNQNLEEGDLLQVGAPKGHFFLDLNDERPVVFLAGGIGVTPIYSMLASLVKFQPHRRAVVFYGGHNGSDFALENDLREIGRRNKNVHLVTCYSKPLETEVEGRDYDVSGHVSLDLLQAVLPSSNFRYFVCGPGPFMSDLVEGLEKWGVPGSDIHFEAFGPASVRRMKSTSAIETAESPARGCKVVFRRTGETVEWTEEFESLLEAAEESGVQVNSGCRAGNCGTCAIALLKGRVKYAKDPGVEPESGKTLSCVACPDGDIEIDA